ncbi:MAG TPA: VOC family protein [Draconibacterium sp.]|nr:VOC family protein [Draconibacterium sp.]
MKNLFIIISFIISSFCSMAQSFSMEMDHISIVVQDVEKSEEFYKNILHLKEVPTPWGENTPLPAVFFDLGNEQELHVTEYNTEIVLHKFTHLAFTVNDFDRYLEFLNEKGIEYGEFSGQNQKFQTRIDGVRQIYFQDPDGYWIEVNDHL